MRCRDRSSGSERSRRPVFPVLPRIPPSKRRSPALDTVPGAARPSLPVSGIQARREELIVVASVFFRLEHGHIGGLHERIHLFTIRRIHADPDAGADARLVLVYKEGLV